MYGKYDFEDLRVNMPVRTWQSKQTDKKIIAIGDKPFHIKVGHDKSDYVEEMHFMNLYQIYINNEWIQFTY